MDEGQNQKMKLETTRFGTLDIEEKQILEFPDGLYGFEKETRRL